MEIGKEMTKMGEKEEDVLKIFTDSLSERSAFIKGVLWGLGFADIKREPNWELLRHNKDINSWIKVEKVVHDINKEILKDQINIWRNIEQKERRR